MYLAIFGAESVSLGGLPLIAALTTSSTTNKIPPQFASRSHLVSSIGVPPPSRTDRGTHPALGCDSLQVPGTEAAGSTDRRPEDSARAIAPRWGSGADLSPTAFRAYSGP